jgi:hypothetical protein
MGLDMWFREDCQRILASVLEVQRNSARSVAALDDEYATAYRQGFVDALCAVAVAFGIRAPTTEKPLARRGPDNEWR